MGLKRSKQYRKLMQQYGMVFGFREPYQVLLDAEMIRDADRFKMDLIRSLEKTLVGQVKPMITQCSMRHLYAAAKEPGVSYLIDKAKTYERRRCGHRPEDYPEPLSTKECLASVVDPKNNKTNKNCYVVASQDIEVRRMMRDILGVPLVYIKRSVMVMEPMADASAGNREKEEKIKFRDGLKRGSGSLKRKRDEDEDSEDEKNPAPSGEGEPKKKKKVTRGPKGPNPLSAMKSKKKVEPGAAGKKDAKKEGMTAGELDGSESNAKRKRRRKHKAGVDGEAGGASESKEAEEDD